MKILILEVKGKKVKVIQEIIEETMWRILHIFECEDRFPSEILKQLSREVKEHNLGSYKVKNIEYKD